jgi:protoporphyrinogen oxidase
MLSVAVIGAGPAGLTAAYLLSKAGVDVNVFEADANDVGGISRTVQYKGYRFDIGGHRFYSKSREVEDLWTEILPDDMLTCSRLSRIYYKGKFYSYPLDIGEVIENLGKRQSLLTLASYIKAKLVPAQSPENLEDWVTSKFGGRLYQMFFKSYTEKVWGIPCRDISADWAAQRIRGLSLSKAARNSLFAGRASRSGANGDRSKEIKTLITSFRYPRLGPGMLWEAATEKIRMMGGRVDMGCRVTGIEALDTGGWRLAINQGGETRLVEADQLISSAPLGWLVDAIRPRLPDVVLRAAAQLRYRDFVTVALILRPRVSFPDNWLYIHDPALKVGRIQNFANWSAEMVPERGMACYGMEYFTNTDQPLWQLADDELIALATKELQTLRLAQPEDVVDGTVIRQAKAYPVYDDDYQSRRLIIKEALRSHCSALHTIGRNGMHQYNNQDHSMMTAMLTVQNILENRQHYDVWQVNQDAEYIESGIAGGSSSQPHQALSGNPGA